MDHGGTWATCAIVALCAAAAAATSPWNHPLGSENFRSMAYSLCYRSDASQADGDSCYGCFMRSTNEVQCNGTEKKLAECTQRHLAGTPFQNCAAIIENPEDTDSNKTSSVCAFEECVRVADTQLLIEQCLTEIPPDGTPVSNYLNMTACILAKARCRMNRKTYGFGPGQLHAMLVTEDMQFRIVDVPGGFVGGYECRSQDFMQPRTVRPARWPSATCSAFCDDPQ